MPNLIYRVEEVFRWILQTTWQTTILVGLILLAQWSYLWNGVLSSTNASPGNGRNDQLKEATSALPGGNP
jgi:hypothetical protein